MTPILLKIDENECKWMDIDIDMLAFVCSQTPQNIVKQKNMEMDIDTEFLYCYEALDVEDTEDEMFVILDLEDICE